MNELKPRIHDDNNGLDYVLVGDYYIPDLRLEEQEERLELIIEQMKAAEGVTEDMKRRDQMGWVGAMNSIRNQAEESVLTEIVYQ